MTERTWGVVLKRVRCNDTGMVTDIFTATRGAVTFAARMAKNGKGKVRAQLLAPLGIVEVTFRWRQQKQMQQLDEVQSAVPYSTMYADPMKAAVALYLQEMLYHALKHEVANPALYRYVTEGLLWLDSHNEGTANFHLAFMVGLTRHLGLWPYTDDWKPGMCFDLKEGVMTDVPPAHPFWLKPEDAAHVPCIKRMTLRSMRLFKLNRMQRNAILEVLTAYYRLHVPEFPPLKSADVLREVFV